MVDKTKKFTSSKRRKRKDCETLPTNKIVKVKLSRIIRSQYSSKIKNINEIVNRVSQITTHTYNFLKLYCISQYETTGALPNIIPSFVMLIMKTIADSTSCHSGRFGKESIPIKSKLEEFYENTYKYLIADSEKLKYDCLIQTLMYECTQIVTAYHNHIQNHFYKFMCRFVNVLTNLKGLVTL